MKKRPSGHNKPSSKKRRQTPPKKKKSAPMKNHKKQVERYMKMTARLGQPKASTATAPNEDSSTKSPESKSPEASSGQKKKSRSPKF
uniref:Uncharacterized protein n=1 Tax=Romanomermis culicivorax TaxID=13658 RepID=A0A915J5T8_ROMCU